MKIFALRFMHKVSSLTHLPLFIVQRKHLESRCFAKDATGFACLHACVDICLGITHVYKANNEGDYFLHSFTVQIRTACKISHTKSINLRC